MRATLLRAQRLLMLLALPATLSLAQGVMNPAPAEALLQRFLAALSNVEYETVVGLFAEDVLFWGTSMQELGTGRAAAAEYFSTLQGQQPGVNVASPVDHAVRIVSDELQLISGTWKVALGASGNSVQFRTSMAVALRDGQWQIVQFHNSALPQ